jgi:hypothetical protein
VNILNKQSQTAEQLISGGLPVWGLGESVTTPHHKKPACYEMLHKTLEWGTCEHGNEPLGSIKGSEFPD